MNEKISKDNEGRVRPGDKLRITSGTWNTILDSVKDYKRNRGREGAGVPSSPLMPCTTVLIRNAMASPIGFYHGVKLGAWVGNLTDDGEEHIQRPVFDGEALSSADDPIVIVQDYLEVDDVGLGVISGITLGYVKMIDPGHKWANPLGGETAFLESVECDGQVKILATDDPAESGFPDDVKFAVLQVIGNRTCASTSGGSVTLDVATKICLNPESGVGIRTQYQRVHFPPGTVLGDQFCVDDEAECCPEDVSYPEPEPIAGCEGICQAGGESYWNAWHVFIPAFDVGSCPSDITMNQTVILLDDETDTTDGLSCAVREGGPLIAPRAWVMGFSPLDVMQLHANGGTIVYQLEDEEFNCDGPNVFTKVSDSCGTDLPETLTVYPGYP